MANKTPLNFLQEFLKEKEQLFRGEGKEGETHEVNVKQFAPKNLKLKHEKKTQKNAIEKGREEGAVKKETTEEEETFPINSIIRHHGGLRSSVTLETLKKKLSKSTNYRVEDTECYRMGLDSSLHRGKTVRCVKEGAGRELVVKKVYLRTYELIESLGLESIYKESELELPCEEFELNYVARLWKEIETQRKCIIRTTRHIFENKDREEGGGGREEEDKSEGKAKRNSKWKFVVELSYFAPNGDPHAQYIFEYDPKCFVSVKGKETISKLDSSGTEPLMEFIAGNTCHPVLESTFEYCFRHEKVRYDRMLKEGILPNLSYEQSVLASQYEIFHKEFLKSHSHDELIELCYRLQGRPKVAKSDSSSTSVVVKKE